MFLQGGSDRVIKLRPLRVTEMIDVFGLPSPLAAIAKHGIALDAGVWSTFPFKT
jgi:hypothetical protein